MKYVRPLSVAGVVASALTILLGCSETETAITTTRAHPLIMIGVLCVILIIVGFAFLNGIGSEPKSTRRKRSSPGNSPENRNEN